MTECREKLCKFPKNTHLFWSHTEKGKAKEKQCLEYKRVASVNRQHKKNDRQISKITN